MKPYSAETVQVRAPKLAERLKEAIDHSPFKLRELADRSGVDKSTISLWTQEAKDGKPKAVRVESVRAVARVLGVETNYLLDIPDPPEEKERDYTLLLQRMAALAARAEQLEDPAADLSETLLESVKRFGNLSVLLEELRDLTAEARRATGE